MCGVRVAAASPRQGVPWSSREVGAWGLGAEQGECAGEHGECLVCGARGPCPRALWTGPVPGREFHPGLGRSVRAIRAWMCESAELCRPGPEE